MKQFEKNMKGTLTKKPKDTNNRKNLSEVSVFKSQFLHIISIIFIWPITFKAVLNFTTMNEENQQH